MSVDLTPAGIAKRLGPAQRDAVLALSLWREEAAPTARELAEALARHKGTPWAFRRTSDAENMAATLRRLGDKLLTLRVGVAADGSRTWALTDLGRQVAAEVAS